MRIWVDADACPVAVKEILFRAARRTGQELTLVANQSMRVPAAPNIRAVQVPGGFDVADDWIAERVETGDLVVTADIPLAAQVVEKGALALSPRGERYGKDNIRELLDLRNFMDTLRGTGVDTGGPAAFGQADRQKFANQLDRLLAQAK
ncbi:MAG: YaiI/YqxD family protein [Azoarcus sp.]|nr:YaiI/YqxD family protein [Azoarcus sp.]